MPFFFHGPACWSVCLFNLSFAFWLGFFLKYYCRFCRTQPIIVKAMESVRLPLTKVCIVLVRPDHLHLWGGWFHPGNDQRQVLAYYHPACLPFGMPVRLFIVLISFIFQATIVGFQKTNLCPFKIYPGFFFLVFFFNSSWSSSPLTFESVQTYSDLSWNSCSSRIAQALHLQVINHISHCFPGLGSPEGVVASCSLWFCLPPLVGFP